MTWLTAWELLPSRANRLVTTQVVDQLLSWRLRALRRWAIAVNELHPRHYYGEFVDAEMRRWDAGSTWGAIFVSPAMHRWHHARDVDRRG